MEDKDQELITVVGTEEAVRDATKELEELIKSLVRLRMNSDHSSRTERMRLLVLLRCLEIKYTYSLVTG